MKFYTRNKKDKEITENSMLNTDNEYEVNELKVLQLKSAGGDWNGEVTYTFDVKTEQGDFILNLEQGKGVNLINNLIKDNNFVIKSWKDLK